MHLSKDISKQFNVNYLYAHAIDPTYGFIPDPGVFPPDFFTSNPNMFKAKKKGSDPDLPSVMEALSGPHRDDFLHAMQQAITELECHKI